jgi:polyhydroxybutyrate depolymerase
MSRPPLPAATAPVRRRRRPWAVVVGLLLVAGAVPAATVVAPPAVAQSGGSLAAACPSATVRPAGFPDVASGDVHRAAIDCAAHWGIAAGDARGRFNPTAPLTRAQTATMLDRLLRQTGEHPGRVPSAGFGDTAGNVHADAIDVLAALGVVQGSGGMFRSEQPVDRGQMASILVRLLEDVHGQQLPLGPGFRDLGGSVHATAIRKLTGAGIASGRSDGGFGPGLAVTRSQTASLVMRSVDRLVVAGAASVPAAPASPGCGVAPPSAGSHTVSVGGQQRTFLLDLPTGYDRNRPTPIVFGFHGAGTSGSLFRTYGNLRSAMGSSAVLVHPDAAGASRAWALTGSGDIAFFDAMLAQLRTRVCIDDRRVFATGHSSGGFFSNVLGCSRGDVLRGIAPVAGGGPFTRPGSCRGRVAAYVAHGTGDTVVPFSSGQGSRDHWVAANGCSSRTQPVGSGVAYQGCAAGSPVRWVAYAGAHEWPRFAPAETWAFFRGL